MGYRVDRRERWMVTPLLGGDTKEEQVWRGGDLDSALDMLSVSCLRENQLAAV